MRRRRHTLLIPLMLMSLPWAACKETRVIPGGEKTRSVTPGGSVVAGKTPATPGKTRRLSVSGSYKMKLLPAGTFRMGAVPEDGNQFSKLAHPPHSVSITRSFYLGLTEVPQWYYSHVASKNHSLCRAANIPAHNVTWYDAVRFANQVSRREGLKPCYTIKGKDVLWPEGPACEGYRLPSEAEWEYAARAGTRQTFAGSNISEEVAWFNETAEEDCAHAVAQKKPNAWGLYDMSGNVWEWVWDWFAPYPGGGARKDPLGPASGKQRVRRGGSWHYPENFVRVSFRCTEIPTRGTSVLGFRLARTALGKTDKLIALPAK